jgi:hyaluronoglucosaminidase
VAGDLCRKPFIWDNSISNDSKIRTNHLFLDPSAGTWELPPDLAAGLAINPMNQAYLSRIALCRFRRLLADAPELPQAMPGICGDLIESSLAQQLADDDELLQKRGLGQLDPDTRRGLLERYRAEGSNPYAQEIVAWLRGEYAFDPQCLTT